ncbi:MAG: hypothetical protein QM786_16690 [Breznakibacter sp.]
MAIRYKMIQRVTPGEKGGGKRAYYPAIVTNQTVQPYDFTELVSREGRLSKALVTKFLLVTSKVLKEQMLDGNIVQIEGLGSFSPGLRYHGEPNPTRVNAKDMEISINFRPFFYIKKELADAKFQKVKE